MTQYPLYRKLVAPQGVTGRLPKEPLPPVIDLRTVQTIESRYIDWAIPAHRCSYYLREENSRNSNWSEHSHTTVTVLGTLLGTSTLALFSIYISNVYKQYDWMLYIKFNPPLPVHVWAIIRHSWGDVQTSEYMIVQHQSHLSKAEL